MYQQQDDWKNEYVDIDNLEMRTKIYLNKHINKDLFMFIYKNGDNIIATCGLQIIDYLPQCNDNGKLGYIVMFIH